jgi:hypothetical protein
MGYIGYAALFALILCLVMITIEKLNYAAPSRTEMTLRITIPENLDYQGMFDDLLINYTAKWLLKRVKTTDFGSLFELQYEISIKKDTDQKAFIDAIRQRNSNLPVQLTLKEFDEHITMN